MAKSRRKELRQKQQRQKQISRLVWGGIGLVLVIAVGYVLWITFRPSKGQSVEVMSDTSHVEEGADPGPYNSDPPTSGRHYASELDAGFYEEAALERYGPYPEGYLVHNLEHGYVIFWYNCSILEEGECAELKVGIKSVMDRANNFKVIGFPRNSIDVPLVMTSWGQMQEFQQFDAGQAYSFVTNNRNKAPEPNAP